MESTESFWVLKQGEGIIAGALISRRYAQQVIDGFDDKTPYSIVSLLPLHQFTEGNYLKPGTVAHTEHIRAKHRGPGAANYIGHLADAIHGFATLSGPDGADDWLIGESVFALCEQLVNVLDKVGSGWDGGTVDTWCRYVATFIGREME